VRENNKCRFEISVNLCIIDTFDNVMFICLADAHLPENEVQRRVKQEDLNRIFPLLSR